MDRASSFPFVKALSASARPEFDRLPMLRARPRSQLLRRGDDCGGAYLVFEGGLRVYAVTEEGREATLYNVNAGDTCVLALSATLQPSPYPAWVESGKHGTRFVRVPPHLFQRLLAEEPAFRTFVLSALSSRVFALMQTLHEVTSSTVTQRVARFLVEHSATVSEVAVTQAHLAAELGTAREVVFRSLRLLSDARLVEVRRGRVRVLDRKGLVARAEGPRPARSFKARV